MQRLAIISHSGYGHTQKLAEHVVKGAEQVQGVSVQHIVIGKDGTISEAEWEALDEAQGIIFGCPTYMGGPSAQFKIFADATSKRWFHEKWNDKLAAGFTNSASPSGDKSSTIQYLITLSMQHGMLWVGTGLHSINSLAATYEDLNWLGGYSGLIAQSPADAGTDKGPRTGDLKTAEFFGARVAKTLLRLTPVK